MFHSTNDTLNIQSMRQTKQGKQQTPSTGVPESDARSVGKHEQRENCSARSLFPHPQCPTTLLLKCCFTPTETVGLLGTGAQDGHLHFHTAPEVCP